MSSGSDTYDLTARLQDIEDVVSPHCPSGCDDIRLSVDRDEQAIISVRGHCAAAKEYFLQERQKPRSAAMIGNEPVSLAAAVDHAARLLGAAVAPLTFGLMQTTTEAQSAAIAVTDRLGGTVDLASSPAASIAMQQVGKVTCTLGEVRHRADFLLYWGGDPAVTDPCHLSRFLGAEGDFITNGRAGRYAVLIDTQRTATAEAMDLFLPVKPGADLELMIALRALVSGVEPAAVGESVAGVSITQLRDLVSRMQGCRYGVILYGERLLEGESGQMNCENILALVRDLNRHTRFVAVGLHGYGNATGAENALAWSTGYPRCVNFGRGYPRYSPGEFSAEHLLVRREVDAALLVGLESLDELSEDARRHLEAIPTVVVQSDGIDLGLPAAVTFNTARFGVSTPGTVYRSDNIALPLRPVLASNAPADVDVLRALEERLLAMGQA